VPSKANLGFVNEEDILNYSNTSLLVLLIEEVLITDLDAEALVLEIPSDYYDLLLSSESSPFSFCFAQ
jgi:hypothetical protein